MFNLRWTLQRMVHPCQNPNNPKTFIIMDFFLLKELDIKLITFYHHTLKYRLVAINNIQV
jgi:hypothetical protein